MFQNMTATSYYENCKLKKMLERQKLEKVCVCCLEQGLVKIVKKWTHGPCWLWYMLLSYWKIKLEVYNGDLGDEQIITEAIVIVE